MKFITITVCLTVFAWIAVSIFSTFSRMEAEPGDSEARYAAAAASDDIVKPNSSRLWGGWGSGLRHDVIIVGGTSRTDEECRSCLCIYDRWTGAVDIARKAHRRRLPGASAC